MAKNKKRKLKRNIEPNNFEWNRIKYYFALYQNGRSTEELWEILKLAMTSEDDDGEIRTRRNMLFFFEHTKELFENVRTILNDTKG